ncbi:hypothetical protein SAMN06295912_108146 [Sphingomonas laterariae]|uniref:Uncharacterized protein n=1 Tax=Edaphosphingomonas laterariae TaxID=861865 RepID=A0A239FAV0_9SPHN|nr:hypothetical protein [Sphingomonas laterariae]SNS53861.1 hypothetical protein SAMN06295912_108146 [Sphingomonas laterariae]
MIRHLIPRIDVGPWGGATLTDPASRTEEAVGLCLCIQWFGILIEIGLGRVSGR